MALRLAYPWVLLIGFPVLILVWLLRRKKGVGSRYRYASTGVLAAAMHSSSDVWKRNVLDFLTWLGLSALLILTARPQLVDRHYKVEVEGVDIVLAIDLSASMELCDDPKDMRRRVDVAKQEAIKFIQRRENDQCALVGFATESLALAPLTLDKELLGQIIRDLGTNTLNPNATALGYGLASSVIKLKNSKAKSRIVVLLTDGCPTPEVDLPIDKAIELAKEQGVKVYCIGVGGNRPFLVYPNGMIRKIDGQENNVDEALLQKIAHTTGGQCFMARNPADIKRAYLEIDKLEKTAEQGQLFARYYDLFWPAFLLALLCFLLELSLGILVWRRILC